MAYVLGYFAADGCITVNNRGSEYIDFYSCDKELLEQVRDVMDSGHKLKERKRKNKNWNTIYRIQIGSKEMCNDLRSLGFQDDKTFTLSLPEMDTMFLPHFVRGYFDGDGGVCLGKYRRSDTGKLRWVFSSRFTSGHRPFLVEIHDMLKGVIVSGGFITHKERGHELVFSHHDSLALYNYMYNNSDCSIYLKRKKEKFEKAFRVLGLR